MPFMPFAILGIWFRGLLALGLLGGGIWLLATWYDGLPRVTPTAQTDPDGPRPARPLSFGERVAQWQPALSWETAALGGGLLLVLVASGGGLLVSRLRWRSGPPVPHPAQARTVEHLPGPDGTTLHLELYGPPEAPPLLVTHGWGVTSAQWYYLLEAMGERYRLVLWDLPGLGHSTRPTPPDYSLAMMARALDTILTFLGPRPVVLVGHSIGGMILLTLGRLFPATLRRVGGMVLAHTTYTNPVRTTAKHRLYTALQQPVLEPLLQLAIWLSPVLWLLTVLSYLNGSAHASTARQSFAGTQTRQQVQFVTRCLLHTSPAVLAHGMLGMLRYDATTTLATLDVPVLLVAGDQDTTTVPAASTFMRAAIPGAQLTTLTPAKHQGLLEHHAQFAEAVAAFAAACLRPDAQTQRREGHTRSSPDRR
jgi:pimeloyl-ACP methyl ester carboxylesterase